MNVRRCVLDRRTFLQILFGISISNKLFASLGSIQVKSNFNISIKGDLDDDLFIIKAAQEDITIQDVFQMHNPSNKFQYNGKIYDSIHIPGAIDFTKKFQAKEDEIYIVMLANEREEAQLSKRVRTHYKNEKLTYNNQALLPALMPEYNSIPNYPLWFGDGDIPIAEREDINGEPYNYYHLFDNTVVQVGLIFPNEGVAKIKLFDKNNNLTHSFNSEIYADKPTRLVSQEELAGDFGGHPFTEIGNILNNVTDVELENNNYITNMTIEYADRIYLIPTPYPMMYPNLIYGVAVNA